MRLWRPDPHLYGFGANARALKYILVRPDVDDLVEGADFRVPEGSELGERETPRQGLTEAAQKLVERARLQRVGAKLVDHRRWPSLAARQQGWSRPPVPLTLSYAPSNCARQVAARRRPGRFPGRRLRARRACPPRLIAFRSGVRRAMISGE